MEEKRLKFPIAAPIFAVLAFFTLIGMFSSGNAFAVLLALLNLAGMVAMAVFLFMKKRDVFLAGGIVAMAACNVLSMLYSFVQMFIWGNSFPYILLDLMNLFGNLLQVVGIVAVLAVVLVCIPPLGFIPFDFTKYETIVKKYWYAPSAVMLLGALVYAFTGLINVIQWPYFENIVWFLGNVLGNVIRILPWLFLTMWIIDPYDNKSAPAQQTVPQQQTSPVQQTSAPQQAAHQQTAAQGIHPIDGASQDLIVHILLLLFTCGIWLYIWIYKTTTALNAVPGHNDRSAVTELLLCFFIPYYWLYWIYKSAQRIDELAKARNIQSDITVLSLVLSLLLGIAGPIIMQDKINAIAKAGQTTAV